MQAHLSGTHLAEFREQVFSWGRKAWLWKQLKKKWLPAVSF